jgi:hypothetical protein
LLTLLCLAVKIDKESLKVVKDELLEGLSMEELAEELPENQPRYILFSYEYNHEDGRVSYPLVFFYWSPISKWLFD